MSDAVAAALNRIAAALERLAPPADDAADPQAFPAYIWQRAALRPARHFKPLPLDLLAGIDAQKAALRATLSRLAAGHPAHDVLLWGARGTGKSALVKSAVADVQAAGGALALIEVATEALPSLPRLFAMIETSPRAYALFIDDLGFDAAGAARPLRSMLEGGAEARPANARFVVTSNRRHLLPRDLEEQASAINPRDSIDDNLALADRFGLSLGFHVLDQAAYLAIVDGYARAFGLSYDADAALGWATQRGARSGRVAWQYIVERAGEEGKALLFV
ncbi:MAG: ATP-binding protein [Sphingomonas sp.]